MNPTEPTSTETLRYFKEIHELFEINFFAKF